jgi:DNA polymerase-3 subunit epsilon
MPAADSRVDSPAGSRLDAYGSQLTLADVGTPLSEVTFVVVDLETTGGAPADAGITEIGAVRIRSGEVLGTFQTLVNPGMPIPPFVAALTGITDAAVAAAPPVAAALPAFLEFLGDAVVVAHNAPYDVGFLSAACRKYGYEWPQPRVVDTARLARVALQRDEVRNCKLATLAAYFRATVTPTHRALDDAQATCDVLHGLLERAGNLGVSTLEDLQEFAARVSVAQRTKRHLAKDMPDAPGVYIFEDAQGTPLYVGRSRSIRTRVRSYFTAAEQRTRMAEMIRIAERITPIVCATDLEARVRELRLIAAQQPRYNRRSRRPEAQTWLKLTVESAPRLSVVRSVTEAPDTGARYLGPFPSRHAAESAAEALVLAHPLRTCTQKIAQRPRTSVAGCALAELGRCLAPCTSEGDRTAYLLNVEGVRAAMDGDVRAVAATVLERMTRLSDEQRFEEAAQWRERLSALVSASVRTHRMASLAVCSELVAAAPTTTGGWEIHLIRHGRLAGATVCSRGEDPRPRIEALIQAGEHVDEPIAPRPAGLTEETGQILAWLDTPGVRLVRIADQGALRLPRWCGGELVDQLAQARRSEQSLLIRDDYERVSGRPVGPADARPGTGRRAGKGPGIAWATRIAG